MVRELENLKYYRQTPKGQTPKGVKDYELLKKKPVSLINELLTQLQRNHISPKKVSESLARVIAEGLPLCKASW